MKERLMQLEKKPGKNMRDNNGIKRTALTGLIVILLICQYAYAQDLSCPLKDGKFKGFDDKLFVQPNFNESGIIYSAETDSVRASFVGKVFKVINHSADSHSVIIMQGDSLAVCYSFLLSVFLKEGDLVGLNDIVGLAQRNKQGDFEVRVSYRKSTGYVDPRSTFYCK